MRTMAKKSTNIFKTSDAIAGEASTQRRSDRSIVQRAKEQVKSAKDENPKPVQKVKRPEPVEKNTAKKKRHKTTIDIDEDALALKTNLMFTIRSSGKTEILPQGDYSVKERDFWLFAVKAAAEKIEKVYGEVRTAPKI